MTNDQFCYFDLSSEIVSLLSCCSISDVNIGLHWSLTFTFIYFDLTIKSLGFGERSIISVCFM